MVAPCCISSTDMFLCYPRWLCPGRLAAVVLDHELLVNRRVDLLATRQALDLGGLLLLIVREPRRRMAVGGRVQQHLEERRLLAALGDGDHVARTHEERRNVDLAAVHQEVTVRDELARLRAGAGQIQTVDDVVEAPLEQLQELRARGALLARRFAEIVLELALHHAVKAAHLLLLAQLAAVFADLLAALALSLLTGGRAAALDRALLGQAAIAFEEQLDLLARLARGGLTPAKAANGTSVACHLFCFALPSLYSTTLRRPASVVRDGRDVLDHRDLETGGLQRADRRLTAGAGTLHEDLDLAHAVLHRFASRAF